ncbi:MAG: PocR ligand-binding domain-containing protein [Clostridia bacterium]|nr:PocR ligand-binding domain-containing protein [Clostridia bacterium]
MQSFFDVQRLNGLLKDFYTAVGIRISVFDENFSLVTEYPKTAPQYCSYIRATKAGANGCKQCDLAACMRARQMQQAHIYVCHAGVTEAITPIRFENGVLGYVILAHMMPLENYEAALLHASKLCENYGLNKDVGLSYLKEIEPRSREQILASTHLLDAVSSYLYVANLVRSDKKSLPFTLGEYIAQNLAGDLSSRALCRKFLLSRTKLYSLSVEYFGMSISRYVLLKRINAAKTLLESQKLRVSEIAEKVGFPEPNYFSKVFKRETGVSPTEYAQQKEPNVIRL